MLQLNSATAPEVGRIAVGREAKWVPESNRSLHPQLTLEGAARKPHLRASGAKEGILSDHARGCNHCQATIVDLCIQGTLAGNWVTCAAVLARNKEPGNPEPAAASEVSRHSVLLLPHWEQLQKPDEGSNLCPPLCRDLAQCRNAIRHISKLETSRR